MLNEKLEAREYSPEVMNTLLGIGEEPRLLYSTFVTKTAGLSNILTVLAREKLFEDGKDVTDKNIAEAEEYLNDWISSVFCNDFVRKYTAYNRICAESGIIKNAKQLANVKTDDIKDKIQRDGSLVCREIFGTDFLKRAKIISEFLNDVLDNVKEKDRLKDKLNEVKAELSDLAASGNNAENDNSLIKLNAQKKESFDGFLSKISKDYFKDSFVNFDKTFTAKSIIAEAVAQGPLENYKIYIPQQTIENIWKIGKGNEKKRIDGVVRFLYCTVYYAISVYKRSDGSWEDFEKRFGKDTVPYNAFALQYFTGVNSYKDFHPDGFLIDGKPVMEKDTVNRNSARFRMKKNLFTKDGKTEYPIVVKADDAEIENSGNYFVIEEILSEDEHELLISREKRNEDFILRFGEYSRSFREKNQSNNSESTKADDNEDNIKTIKGNIKEIIGSFINELTENYPRIDDKESALKKYSANNSSNENDAAIIETVCSYIENLKTRAVNINVKDVTAALIEIIDQLLCDIETETVITEKTE